MTPSERLREFREDVAAAVSDGYEIQAGNMGGQEHKVLAALLIVIAQMVLVILTIMLTTRRR